MRFKFFLFYLVLSIFVGSLFENIAFTQEKEEIINSTIIEMAKAKFGEAVIINKIKSSKTNFNLSTDSLIKLKEAGVSDNIINAMLEAQNPRSQSPAEQQDVTAASGDVFVMQNGKLVEMEYTGGFTKQLSTSMFWMGTVPKTKFVIMASGEHAQMRLTDKSPVFYLRLHPSEVGIVKFDTDTYNKKPVRYVMRVGELWQTGGQAGAPSAGNIDFGFKKEPNGLYKITLKSPLENGEYGIIAGGTGGGGGPWSPSSSYKIYDFAIGES